MALLLLQHSPADQGTPLYPAARQSILVRLVGKVMAQGLIPAGVWGMLTQSLTLQLLGCEISLSNVLLHMTCVSGVLVPYWTLYFGAVPLLLRTLKGFWVECSAEFVSPVFFIYLFIFYFIATTSIDIHCSIYI